MSSKRLSEVFLALALVVPLLAACGTSGDTANQPSTVVAVNAGEATPAPAADAPAAADVPAGEGATAGASGDVTKIAVEDGAEIRIVVNGNPTEQQLYQDGIARFRKLFPNVTVDINVSNDNYETNMKAQFSAGTGPDVMLLPSQLLGAFGPEGLLLPLDEPMQTAGVQKDDYVESLINLFTLDGKVYGLPKDFNPLVVFINEDLASEAGVDPTSIKTWEDLKTAAEKMTKGDGPGKQYGMCLNADIERYGSSMLQNGNAVVQDKKAVFNEPNGVAAIDFWYSFKQSGTGELYKQLGKGWCGEAFSSRTTAMAVEGGWIVPFLADPANNATDLKYTAIPMPIPEGGQPATWLFTNGFGVNGNTQFPNAAAALAIYMTSAQNQSALIPSGLAQPSLTALASDPYYNDNPVGKVLIEQGPTGQLSDSVLGGPINKGDVISSINQAMEAVFLGQATAQDALTQAAQEVDGVLSR